MNQPDDTRPREARRIIYAGLLGLAAAGLIQLSDKNDLAPALLVEVCAFAVAIPLLSLGLVVDWTRQPDEQISGAKLFLGDIGALASVVGLAALFFHFGLGPGIVFVAVTFIGIVLVRML